LQFSRPLLYLKARWIPSIAKKKQEIAKRTYLVSKEIL
jgi:hypothetical protein